ncbi:MAG TPA: HAD family phosphatase [Lentimicrobium sp.]|nr:HAD family phosphatase [Lentimicrobium sp.]
MKHSIAVIFDMDGVLADNFRYHLMAWEKFCARHGKSITADDFRENVFGGSNTDHLNYIFKKNLSPAKIEEYSAEKEMLYRYLYHDNVQLLPGLRDFLGLLKDAGIPMAVATSAERANVDFIVQEAGLEGYFSAVSDASMVKRGKPDPEVFLKAAGLLGIGPENCLVFEDTLKGIDAALKAKMKVVGVATTHHQAELTEAHCVISDFTEMDCSAVERIFNL